MAESTNPNLSKQMIYSVFVRNHSREGTFAKVEEDLDRIRDLGTDILWLMPIHPTGKVERKGEDGSPYAIADYWKIDPKMGTEEDLKHLVQSAHEKGMKVILDIVFNHTSPDSKMVGNIPNGFTAMKTASRIRCSGNGAISSISTFRAKRFRRNSFEF